MESCEYIKKLEAVYNQIPPQTCLNCQECCVCKIVCSAIEYLYIKIYIEEYFTVEQKKSLDKRIMMNYSIETLFGQKKGKVRCMPCFFREKEKKKCSIYPARTFLARIYGLKGFWGSCGHAKITDGRDFGPKEAKRLAKEIKDISKLYLSKYGLFDRNYDFMQNWFYVDKFGKNGRIPLGENQQELDVEGILDGRPRLGDGKGFYDVEFEHFF